MNCRYDISKGPRTRVPALTCTQYSIFVCHNWDDFHYKTNFSLIIFDTNGVKHDIGSVKIGHGGQEHGWTAHQLQQSFTVLPENYFSLGQDAEYYENLVSKLPSDTAESVLKALGDVAFDPARRDIAEGEQVFRDSLLRYVTQTSIENHFQRILHGNAPLTEFDFSYSKAPNDRFSGIDIELQVEPNSKPSTNIHVLIGRNGVGKTTLLNNMVNALLPDRGEVEETGCFKSPSSAFIGSSDIDPSYFAGVVSVSFSAFDPFSPPADQIDAAVGMRYYYVGLKKRVGHGPDEWGLKDQQGLCKDFITSLEVCFALSAKKQRWIKAVNTLKTDENFAEMPLDRLTSFDPGASNDHLERFREVAADLFQE